MKPFLLISTLLLLSVLCHAQWVTNGLQLSTTPDYSSNQQIAMSKSNSAWVVWEAEDTAASSTNVAIYLTGFDFMGDPLNGFTGGAIDICDSGNYSMPQIIVSSDSNIIVTWYGNADSTSNYREVYIQKYTQAGVPIWNGSVPLQVSLSDSSQNNFPLLASDLHGGAYICWTSGAAIPPPYKVLVQRIDSSGHVASGWSALPIHIGDVPDQNEWYPKMAVTPAGDAVYVMYQRGLIGDLSQWVVRIDAADGSVATGFTGSGVEISAGPNLYPVPLEENFIFCDSSGNALCVWTEDRISENGEIYYQKTSPTGTLYFAANGKMMAGNNASGFSYLYASLDDDGSILATWNDYVNNYDVGCIKFNTNGNLVWPIGSYTYPITTNTNSAYPKILPDHTGGSYIFYNNVAAYPDGLFCLRLDSAGALSWALPGLYIGANLNNGFEPQLGFSVTNVNFGQSDVTWYNYGRDTLIDVFACDVLPSKQSCFDPILAVPSFSRSSNSVVIYPNPSVNEFTVSIPQKNSSAPFYIELYNEIGMLVLSQSIIQTTTVVNTSALSSGFYFAKVFDEQGGCIDVKKIIIK